MEALKNFQVDDLVLAEDGLGPLACSESNTRLTPPVSLQPVKQIENLAPAVDTSPVIKDAADGLELCLRNDPEGVGEAIHALERARRAMSA